MSQSENQFDHVFSDHASFVRHVLVRHGVHAHEIEDVCQEVFLVVCRRLSEFEGRSSLKTWIYGICRRVASNHRALAVHRRQSPRASAQDVLAAQPSGCEGEAFDALARKQSLRLLEALLARLPDEQRRVVVLHEIEELSMREVAEALDCSPNTAFSRLYAAREALSKMRPSATPRRENARW